MWRRLMLLTAATTVLALGQPATALAKDCEDTCGELAAKNCEDIDSFKCALYIMGCLAGCSVGEIVDILT